MYVSCDHTIQYTYERLGENVEFEEKHIMEKNGFEVPGGGGVGGDGDWVGGCREISGKSPGSPIIKIGLVKRQIKVFTIFVKSDCGEIILRSWWIHPLNI